MTAASVVADLAMVERDLEDTAGALQKYFRVADDEDPTLPLHRATEALMRAVATLHRVVEKQQRTTAGLAGRVNSVELMQP